MGLCCTGAGSYLSVALGVAVVRPGVIHLLSVMVHGSEVHFPYLSFYLLTTFVPCLSILHWILRAAYNKM